MTAYAPRTGAVLFCPFCRESYEGEERCPAHDLELVPFTALPKKVRALGLDERLPALDPRYGRGWIALGAAALLIAFLFPFVTVEMGERLTPSGMLLATQAPNLWSLPCVALALFSILARRRSLGALRGATLVVVALAALGAFSVLYTVWRLGRALALQTELPLPTSVHLNVGAWLALIGLALVAYGGLRLGRPSSSAQPQ